jgi:hypothetical protein
MGFCGCEFIRTIFSASFRVARANRFALTELWDALQGGGFSHCQTLSRSAVNTDYNIHHMPPQRHKDFGLLISHPSFSLPFPLLTFSPFRPRVVVPANPLAPYAIRDPRVSSWVCDIKSGHRQGILVGARRAVPLQERGTRISSRSVNPLTVAFAIYS